MANSKIVFSENGLKAGVIKKLPKFNDWVEHTYQRLKESAKSDPYYINLYKVVKKRRKRNAENATKRSLRIRKIFTVTNVTDNSFTIS